MQISSVLLGAVPKPGADVSRQDTLDGAGVIVLEHPQWQMEVSKSSEEEETLTGFLNQGVDVTGPCQVLSDVDTQVSETVHSLHWRATDDEGLVIPCLLCSEVHNQLLSLADV